MTLWHGAIDTGAIGVGANVTITSSHHVVRLVTADQLTIETSSGARQSAIIVERMGVRMRLSLLDGRSVELSMKSDGSLRPIAQQTEFSRQDWRVERLR